MLSASTSISAAVVVGILDLCICRASLGFGTGLRKLWRCGVFAIFSYLLFAGGFSPFTQPLPSTHFERYAAQVFGVMWWFQCALVLIIFVDVLLLPKTWHTQRLFHDLAAGVIFVAATVAALGYVLALPVTGLVATSGAVAVVFGLAIQNTLNDLFSGIVLNTTEAFQLDDWISIGELEGKVVESNWRATKLLNELDNLVVVPNSVAAKSTITNLSYPPDSHGIKLEIRISPEARPTVVLEALERAAASSMDILISPAPAATVKTFETDSIDYELICYVNSLPMKSQAKNHLYDLVHRHLCSAGISLHPLSVALNARGEITRRRQLLRAVEIFRYVDDTELGPIEDALTRRVFNKGDVVYQSASNNHVLTILDSGVASVTVPSLSGDAEVQRMAPGDAIGQSGVLAGARLHATVHALTPAIAYELNSTQLSPLLLKRPDIGERMCQTLTEHRSIEEKLMSPPEKPDETSPNFYAWIESGMKKLHKMLG
jgi:small-conductance mechanosensitive channel